MARIRTGERAKTAALLSEASGLESGADLDDEEEKQPDPPFRTLRPRTLIKYDVNFIPKDENEDDYESFDSGESEEEDLGDDKEDPERGGQEDDDDVLSEGDAEQLDEAFIASLMIGNDALSKQDKRKREDALRATEWTTTSSEFEVGAIAYTGMGDKMAQPVAELRALA
ncbi:hypothetical protein BBJ28_00021800, partial [Nothophytophthora sp. Chile5]